MEKSPLLTRLSSGELDGQLLPLYGESRLASVRTRYSRIAERFEASFGRPAQAFFSAPGRTELGGNHTDHQHGHVLAAAVDMDMLAAAAPNASGVIRILSDGYPDVEVRLDSLDPVPAEKNTSAALVRGVAARFAQLGVDLAGAGLEACLTSDVPGGSGLSSSAAYEVLIGAMLNCLFAQGRFDAVQLAQIGQWAENQYFGKPCGLMDQTACSVGGVAAIDFADPADPVVERIGLDLRSQGYALCILDSRAGHADLTDEYAAITGELGAVSGHFGKTALRDVPEADFAAAIPALRREAGDRAVLRAMHFYAEDRRAVAQADALRSGDFEGFLRLVRASGASSALYLQNVVPAGQTREQALMLCIALAERILDGRGAVRVHGGGFGGTAQAFVPLDALEDFCSRMETVLGPGSCHVLSVRPAGGVMIA